MVLEEHGLYVECNEGKHYIEGQVNYADDPEDDVYVGFWLAD